MMTLEHLITVAVFRRCRELAQRYLGALGPDQVPGIGIIDDVLVCIQRHATEEERAGADGCKETRRQHLLERILRRHHLYPLMRLMRGPGIVFGDQRPLGGSELALAARCAAAEAEVRREQLIAAGLPATFLSDLLASVRALEESIAARVRYRQTVCDSRASLEAQMRRGSYALDLLEGALFLRTASEPRVRTAWRKARRRTSKNIEQAITPGTAATTRSSTKPEDTCVR